MGAVALKSRSRVSLLPARIAGKRTQEGREDHRSVERQASLPRRSSESHRSLYITTFRCRSSQHDGGCLLDVAVVDLCATPLGCRRDVMTSDGANQRHAEVVSLAAMRQGAASVWCHPR